jgi:hypothetical protein
LGRNDRLHRSFKIDPRHQAVTFNIHNLFWDQEGAYKANSKNAELYHKLIEEGIKLGTEIMGNERAALVFFDNLDKASEVSDRLFKIGPWAKEAFQQCNRGVHGEATADLNNLIRCSDKLCQKLRIVV